MDPKEAVKFTQRHIVIEEKVDGSNLGISITEDYQIRFQNRSHFVNASSATQFKTLDHWVTQHPGIWQVLTSPDIVLFGEWMYAKHSIHYTRLPDYFIAFDVYDRKTSTSPRWHVVVAPAAVSDDIRDQPISRAIPDTRGA